MIRASVRSPAGAEAEEALVARLLELFPAGLEEERDDDGRLVLSAYVESAGDVPADLGSVRFEAVGDGWEARWREFHHGVAIADRLWVGPPWESAPAGLVKVVIDPGQAFGTGAHATTALCLELLCELESSGPVLDVGCGSGVLAVAAALLGFAPVAACDDDPVAVAATRANAVVNGAAVEAFLADALCDPLPAAPLLIANILLAPLEALFARADVRPERAIVSGLLASEHFEPAGYRIADRRVQGDWQALVLTPRR